MSLARFMVAATRRLDSIRWLVVANVILLGKVVRRSALGDAMASHVPCRHRRGVVCSMCPLLLIINSLLIPISSRLTAPLIVAILFRPHLFESLVLKFKKIFFFFHFSFFFLFYSFDYNNICPILKAII